MKPKGHALPGKRIIYSTLFALLLIAAPMRAAEEQRIVDFTLFLRNDVVVRLDSRQKRLNIEKSAFDIVAYERKADTFRQVRKLNWPTITREIYSIDLINSNRTTYSKARLLLTRQDGTQTVIEHGSLYRRDGKLLDAFYFSEYNDVASRWTRGRLPLEKVKKVVLGSNRLMINPKTGTLYPPDYRYDPITGTPLAESALEED